MDEDLMLRANLLGGMDSYARDHFDEDSFEIWLMYGIPDECDEDTLMEIAEDDDEFKRICGVFGRMVNIEG